MAIFSSSVSLSIYQELRVKMVYVHYRKHISGVRLPNSIHLGIIDLFILQKPISKCKLFANS